MPDKDYQRLYIRKIRDCGKDCPCYEEGKRAPDENRILCKHQSNYYVSQPGDRLSRYGDYSYYDHSPEKSCEDRWIIYLDNGGHQYYSGTGGGPWWTKFKD